MIDVEEQLRQALARHADDAPRSGQLLDRVRMQSRRRKRRYRAGVTSVVAIAAAVAAVALVSYEPDPAASEQPAAAPVRFAPGPLSDATFPFTPTMPLAGSDDPVVALTGGQPTLRYKTGVDVTVGKPPTDNAVVVLAKNSISVAIRSVKPIPTGTLQVYVDNLLPEPMPLTPPFRFDLVPVGFTVDNVEPAAVTFAPPGVPPSAGFTGKIAVMLDSGSSDETTVTDDSLIVRRSLGDGRTVTVQAPVPLRLSEAELVRFAAGVHPTDRAEVGQG